MSANDGSGIFEIDPLTGSLTFLSAPDESIRALEFAPDGRLYGGFADLYELSPSTGEVLRRVGGLTSFIRELDFAPDGQLYGINFESSGANPSLYQISLESGANDLDRLVVTAADPGLGSLASVPVTVPEPTAALIALCSITGLVAGRRRRRQ